MLFLCRSLEFFFVSFFFFSNNNKERGASGERVRRVKDMVHNGPQQMSARRRWRWEGGCGKRKARGGGQGERVVPRRRFFLLIYQMNGSIRRRTIRGIYAIRLSYVCI